MLRKVSKSMSPKFVTIQYNTTIRDMKQLITLFLFIFVAGSLNTYAQQRSQRGQKGPNLSKEERVDAVTTRLYVALELNDEQMKATKKAILTHMTEVETIRDEAEGRPDLEKIGKSMNDMDARFEEIFNKDQYIKYSKMKDKIFNRRQGRMNSRDGRRQNKRGGGNR